MMNTTHNKHEINGKPVRFTYLRDSKEPRRVLTVARIKEDDNTTIHYSVAVCAPGDQFEKAKARAICEGRLHKFLETGRGDSAGTIVIHRSEENTETEEVLNSIAARLPETATSLKRTALEGTFNKTGLNVVIAEY
jgi:hypothetical protein